MLDLLLQTKLYIPPASSALVARRRLLDRLQVAVRARLTLVAAPAGFGKTTLVASLIAHLADQRTNPQFCWLSLDANDNDPNRFFQYWIAALQTLVPQCGRQTQALLRAPQPSPPDTVLTLLVNEMATLTDPIVLVLDDYHLITAPAIQEMLTLIIEHLPPALHLLMVSRADPPLPLARWRVRGQLVEVRAAELRFTNVEIATFFNEVMGLHLTPADLATLEQRTEGWIAALQLAALSMQGEVNVQPFLQSFSGGQRYVVDYLVDEVLNRQPVTTQHFLLQTSILSQFCAALCDAVIDAPVTEASTFEQRLPAQTHLEQLERSNLFLIPLDNERRWYRYHALFAEFLRHRLGPSAPDYHRRAAAWYRQNGFVEETIAHTLAAHDNEQAAGLIATYSLPFALRQQLTIVDSWLNALPPDLQQNHLGVAISRVWLMVGRGDVMGMVQGLQRVDALIAQQPLAADSVIASEVAAAHALVGSFRQDHATTMAYAQQALRGLPADAHQLRLAVMSGLGYGHYCAGDLSQAEQTLRAALGIATTDYVTTYVTLLSMLVMVLEMQGRLPEALALIRQAQTHALVDGHYLPAAGVEVTLHALGMRLYEFNALDEAKAHVQTARTLSLTTGNAMIQAHTLATLALIAQARDNLQQAQTLIDEAHAVINPLRVPSYAIIEAQRVFLWCKRGNLAAASAWAAQFVATMPARPQPLTAFATPYFSLARVWIAQEQFDEADQLLADLYHAATTTQHHYYALWALILQIKSSVAQGDYAAAQRTLAETLQLALPSGYIRSFIDEGEFMRTQLITYQSHHKHSAEVTHYLEQILAAFDPAHPAVHPASITPTQQISKPKIQNLIEPLSMRELEVLQLLARGHSNQAIADELIIALSTVKKHLINIYGKLDVNSRTQALTRARDLQLL